ncbi:hypothetical protein KHQ81_06630 [Mycoplasmatota bacterium]|nr:hypothetical protein KHQ81_06630 [Mycoplasmatota bacterium]
MKKVLGITIIILLVLVFLYVGYFIFAMWQWWGWDGVERHDLNDFVEKNYVNYNSGDNAALFFPDYETLSNYESISFNYIDNTRKNSL